MHTFLYLDTTYSRNTAVSRRLEGRCDEVRACNHVASVCDGAERTAGAIYVARGKILSPKRLDATGNNGVDTVACDSFDRIVAMLRWGLRNVWVNDVENVLSRGRKARGSQEAFDSREQVFDTMSLSEMKLLNRVAMHE